MFYCVAVFNCFCLSYEQLPKGPTAVVNPSEWSSGGIMVLAAIPIAFMSAFYGEALVRDRYCLVFNCAFQLCPSSCSIIVNPIHFRVDGNRVHLFVSSVTRWQYYLSYLLVDLIMFIPVAILVPVLLLAFQVCLLSFMLRFSQARLSLMGLPRPMGL